MLLQDKHILIFAATGAIGRGVARRFAQEGARVWLSGRNQAALATLTQEITAEGGTAAHHVVDAVDADAVSAYCEQVQHEAGRIDVVFNAIGVPPSAAGIPEFSTKLALANFLKPLNTIVASTFLTSRSAGKIMMEQGYGSIVTLSAVLSGVTLGYVSSASAVCGAVEALTRALAGEYGRSGVRVNCVRANGMPETRTIQENWEGMARLSALKPLFTPSLEAPLVGPLTVADTAAVATFLASDLSKAMTAQVINVDGGIIVS